MLKISIVFYKLALSVDGLNLTHRGIYSCAVALLQYLLPLLVVLIIYAMIYRFLRQQQYPRHLRQNNTNLLLASISITHCLIWLPFSVFNILADLWGEKVRKIMNLSSNGFLFGAAPSSLKTQRIPRESDCNPRCIFLGGRRLHTIAQYAK